MSDDIKPVAWKHDCVALLQNDVELWIDRCPHCGKPTPLYDQATVDQLRARVAELEDNFLSKSQLSRICNKTLLDNDELRAKVAELEKEVTEIRNRTLDEAVDCCRAHFSVENIAQACSNDIIKLKGDEK